MLTEVQCKNAVCPPDKKRLRLTDAAGLYLEVSPAGSWKTYTDGKEGRLALGSYPDVTLKAVRLARDAAKRDRAAGIDLVQARKIARLKSAVATDDTFKATALEWYGKNEARWSSHYAIREKRNLEKDLFPYFAERHVGKSSPSSCWPRCAAWRSAVRWTWPAGCCKQRGPSGAMLSPRRGHRATSLRTSRVR